jgi:hypothetical protein
MPQVRHNMVASFPGVGVSRFVRVFYLGCALAAPTVLKVDADDLGHLSIARWLPG